MSELLRMRMARSPQRSCSSCDDRFAMYPGGVLSNFAENVLTPGAASRSNIPAGFLLMNGLSAISTDLDSPVNALDQWLSCRDNAPRQKDLFGFLAETADEGSAPILQWLTRMAAERTRLADLLLACFFAPSTPDLRARIARLLAVIALIELLEQSPGALSTPEKVFAALRWRTLVLPRELHDLFDTPEFRRSRVLRAGFADLFVAREEWLRYELGEISHIENVRAGELKERTLSRLSEQEQTTTLDTERTTFEERSTETTDRFELADEATREMQLALSMDLSVDTSGQYGPTKVDTHLGGGLEYSQAESSRRASTQIKESITRAVSRVEERVRSQQVVRSLVRTKSRDLHSLSNDSDVDRVSVYRWVEKIKRVQVFRYRNRYLQEFEIPEPGAWWRWLMSQPRTSNSISPKPSPFTLSGNAPANASDRLTYDDITPGNYQQLGARYLALGLEPPPSTRVLSVQVSSTSDMGGANDVVYVVDKNLSVPAGYVATTWRAGVMWSPRQGAGPGSVTFAVGVAPPAPPAIPASSGGYAGGGVAQPVYLTGNVGGINTGSIPVVASGYLTDSYTLNLTVFCDPSPEGLVRWKIATYERLAGAYADMQRQYDEEQRSIDAGIPSIADRYSPGRNQEIIRDELKKHVISMLTGVDFNGRGGLIIDAAYERQPFIDMEMAEVYAPEIQFIEQAFEWGNLSYVFYPYFWAARDRWPETAPLDGADPDFVRFLRAGSARVVVSARPGFEAAVQLYAKFGVLWGGGPVPAPDEPGYLSIADEIKSLQQAPDDGEPGESWEVRLPTSLICLGDGEGLPVNDAVTLDPPPGLTLP